MEQFMNNEKKTEIFLKDDKKTEKYISISETSNILKTQ